VSFLYTLKDQIIQLDSTDNVDSVRDRLTWIRANTVLLVFPEDPRSQILQRQLDLVILKRQAEQHDAQLVLIATDPVVVQNARDIDLPTFSNVDDYHRRRVQAIKPLQVQTIHSEEIDVNDEETVDPSDQVEEGSRLRLNAVPVGGFFIVFLLAMPLLAIFVPSATITLVPESDPLAVELDVIADPSQSSIDSAANRIPARILTVEVSGSAVGDTTGETSQSVSRSVGSIIVVNETEDQITIPQGTRVFTSDDDPIVFVTTEDITLSGVEGDSLEVAIEALEEGDQYNLETNTLTQVDDAYDPFINVLNVEPTQGGESVSAASVTRQDMLRLRNQLLEDLEMQAQEAVSTDASLLQTEFVPRGGIELAHTLQETYSAQVGDNADELRLDMRVEFRTVAVDERPARELVYREFVREIEGGQLINQSSVSFDVNNIELAGEGTVAFTIRGSGNLITEARTLDVKRSVLGKNISVAQNELQDTYGLTDPPSIEVFPSFWPILPILPAQIDVKDGLAR